MSAPHTLTTRDGLQLFRRNHPLADARGTVLIVHGISEHSGRYVHVAERLLAMGWAVESYDQRGHGLSPGQRGGLNADDDLVDDLGAMVRAVRSEQQEAGRPLVLLGHSLGGLTVGRYMAGFTERKRPAWLAHVDAAVMVSPALRVHGGLPPFVVKAARRIVPGLSLSTKNWFEAKDICNDPAVVQAYLADRLVHTKITPRLACFIDQAGAITLDRAPHWTKPTLLMYSAHDRIVDPRGSAEFSRRVAVSLLRSQAFEAHAHELLNEADSADVFGLLGSWLADQAGKQLTFEDTWQRQG